MDKIQQHRESREAAIISAIKVIVDTVSENDGIERNCMDCVLYYEFTGSSVFLFCYFDNQIFQKICSRLHRTFQEIL